VAELITFVSSLLSFVGSIGLSPTTTGTSNWSVVLSDTFARRVLERTTQESIIEFPGIFFRHCLSDFDCWVFYTWMACSVSQLSKKFVEKLGWHVGMLSPQFRDTPHERIRTEDFYRIHILEKICCITLPEYLLRRNLTSLFFRVYESKEYNNFAPKRYTTMSRFPVEGRIISEFKTLPSLSHHHRFLQRFCIFYA